MASDIKTALRNMFQPKAIVLTLIIGACLGVLAYTTHGILVYALAIPVLFLVFEFSIRLFEVKQGIPRRPFWDRHDVGNTLVARIVQTLIITVFWGTFMVLFDWPKDLKSLALSVVIFGAVMFLVGEWQARRREKAEA